MERARNAIALFVSAARRIVATTQPPTITTGKRKSPEELVNDENSENFSRSKNTRLITTAEHDAHLVEEANSICLSQNRFKCLPALMTLLCVDDDVVLTFPLSLRSELDAFLANKGVDSYSCFQTKLYTSNGPRISLLGKVIENDPLVTNVWELMRDDVDGSTLYDSGCGVVVSLRTTSGDPITLVLMFADLSEKTVDLWTSRHIADFGDLKESFRKMDQEHQIIALVHMSNELDPQQQIWVGREFYKSYVEARRRLSFEQDRESKRSDKKRSEQDEKQKSIHEDELRRTRASHLVEASVLPEEVNDLFRKELHPKKLKEFSEMMDKDVVSCRNRLVMGFSKFQDVLIDYDMMRKWVDRCKTDFPLAYQSLLATILPHDHKGNVDETKEYAAFWRFISGMRIRNPQLCHEIAVIFTLSQMSTTVPDKSIKMANKLGNASSKSSAARTIKLLNDLNGNPCVFLQYEKWLVMGFDNLQYNLPQKVQTQGKSTNAVDGTSRFSRKITKFVPPDCLPFVTNEGQPGATFRDQPIPAPIGMPPFECLDDKKFEKLLSHGCGIRESLIGETFQRDILARPIVTERFDLSEMEATDGTRSQAYLNYLRRNAKYVALWQFLSSHETIKSTGHPIGPVTPEAWAVQEIIHAARKTELGNARAFHREAVRTWNHRTDEETLTFVHSVSKFTEKTTEGTARVIVELLIDAGILILGDERKNILLSDDYEERVAFMCGDAYSVNNGFQFAKMTETSIGRYSNSYETNLNISKALHRIVWFPGDLHVEFHMCKAIYDLYYSGFIHSFQACGQVTRLVQDSTKCFQLAKTFLRLVYEQIYRGLAIRWWFSLPKNQNITTVHEAVKAFEKHLEAMCTSEDEVRRYLATFFDLCEVYFLFSDCVACQDSIGEELLLSHFQPIFYFLGMTNYKEVTWREHEMLYSMDRPLLERETLRRHRNILLNKGKHAIGTDTFCELLNGKVVAMKKSKDIEKCAARSSAVTTISHSDAFCKKYVCDEDVDKPPKSSTKKRTTYIRDRISELIIVSTLLVEQDGRKIKDVDLYAPLDDLMTCLRVAPNADDREDDEITLAEDAVAQRNETISIFIQSVIPQKGKVTSEEGEGVETEEDGESGEGDEGKQPAAKRPKKILVENSTKIRIGTSHQERMKIDPKKMATVNPFEKGKEMVDKDNVKQKKERKRKEHERKCKLAQMCHVTSRQALQALDSLCKMDQYLLADQDETKWEFDDELSTWT